jgi:hypothetical protein
MHLVGGAGTHRPGQQLDPVALGVHLLVFVGMGLSLAGVVGSALRPASARSRQGRTTS